VKITLGTSGENNQVFDIWYPKENDEKAFEVLASLVSSVVLQSFLLVSSVVLQSSPLVSSVVFHRSSPTLSSCVMPPGSALLSTLAESGTTEWTRGFGLFYT
jgi:hypothetical protein